MQQESRRRWPRATLHLQTQVSEPVNQRHEQGGAAPRSWWPPHQTPVVETTKLAPRSSDPELERASGCAAGTTSQWLLSAKTQPVTQHKLKITPAQSNSSTRWGRRRRACPCCPASRKSEPNRTTTKTASSPDPKLASMGKKASGCAAGTTNSALPVRLVASMCSMDHTRQPRRMSTRQSPSICLLGGRVEQTCFS